MCVGGGGVGVGMMRVYLKHGDPMAEGCLGAGMNKTLMAHKTQRPLLRAQLTAFIPAGPDQSHSSNLQTQRSEDRGKEKWIESDRKLKEWCNFPEE